MALMPFSLSLSHLLNQPPNDVLYHFRLCHARHCCPRATERGVTTSRLATSGVGRDGP
jgi:hypothetical protein